MVMTSADKASGDARRPERPPRATPATTSTTLALNRVSSLDRLSDVRRWLREWLANAFDRDSVERVQLIATELLTNAVIHGGGTGLPRADLLGNVLRFEVRDLSTRLPRLRDPEPNATNGRGLLIIDSVSDRWGVELMDDEKIVWSEVTVNSV